jgi:AraC family transcriptional regulator of adaptative response/methylated-DNA-[protein]-cysteine methyltransferase
MIATTQRGICRMSFLKNEDRSELINQLCGTWPRATFSENQDHILAITNRIFGERNPDASRPLHLHVTGTNFQVNVWQALLAIPFGRLVSYRDIAAGLGKPDSVRAVASAVAVNPVAYLIPCHRVITKTGSAHRYRWGKIRKKAIIGWEAAATM